MSALRSEVWFPNSRLNYPKKMVHTKKELINGETSLIGVLGCPIKHSLSPIIHNAALTALNLNWCYLAIPCETENLELVLESLRKINCKGLNITIPHKQEVINYCKAVEPIAKNIGAVNTLIPAKDNYWNGTNTDIQGFLAPLKKCESLAGKNGVVLGSGGSARAVVHGLNSLNLSHITIISRNKNSLKKFLNLIEKTKSNSTTYLGLIEGDSSIKEYIRASSLIVNTTPVGMLNKSEKKASKTIPLGKEYWEDLSPGKILYDLIYIPKPTEWLKLGLKYDCHQINGLDMLIEQGAASLRLWSNIEEIPIDIMKEAAEKALRESS